MAAFPLLLSPSLFYLFTPLSLLPFLLPRWIFPKEHLILLYYVGDERRSSEKFKEDDLKGTSYVRREKTSKYIKRHFRFTSTQFAELTPFYLQGLPPRLSLPPSPLLSTFLLPLVRNHPLESASLFVPCFSSPFLYQLLLSPAPFQAEERWREMREERLFSTRGNAASLISNYLKMSSLCF